MDVSPERPSHILTAIALSSIVNLAEHQRVETACPPPLKILHNKNDYPCLYLMIPPLPVSVDVMHYGPAPGRLQQMFQLVTAQQIGHDRLNEDCREGVAIADRYKRHRPKFLKMLEEFETKWEGHLRRITTSRNRSALTSYGVRLVHSIPFQSGPNARQFDANEVDRTLKEDIIKPATTEWLIPIVLATKKAVHSDFPSCIKSWSPETLETSIRFPARTTSSTHWEKWESFQLCMQTSFTGKSKSTNVTAKRPSLPVITACTSLYGCCLERARHLPTSNGRSFYSSWRSRWISSTLTILASFQKPSKNISITIYVSWRYCKMPAWQLN